MRPYLGPRLFLRKRGDGPPIWYIRDAYRMQSTGLTEAQSDAAERALLEYAEGAPISVAVPQTTKPETVYFVSCEVENFPVKIGTTFDVPRRLAKLQGSLPYPVVLLGTMPGGLDRERSIHLVFRQCRLRGEWFARTTELMDFIRAEIRPTVCRNY